jgi:hypothetical protein
MAIYSRPFGPVGLGRTRWSELDFERRDDARFTHQDYYEFLFLRNISPRFYPMSLTPGAKLDISIVGHRVNGIVIATHL